MRDCSEGYENGHQDGHKDVYLIQPMTSPAPFLVQCHFGWGGIIYPLWRVVSETPWSNVTWEQAKEGFGDDLSLRPGSTNFFIGLEKLHQILAQSVYNCQVLSKYGASWTTSTAFYDNFTVGHELSSYALSYGAFYDRLNTPSSNGLNGSSPVVFATVGKDPHGCVGSRGAAGWYGSDCGGHSMFADPPTWPVPGQGSLQLSEVLVVLVRKGPFF
ncbi:fibrinogen gamma chain-like [Littorina saxatilis]|uniref:fibrinogen gamma chain-like n=1 Tax=Littorina saxatilis TaxID=31220 RepID=UPI0038B4F5BE